MFGKQELKGAMATVILSAGRDPQVSKNRSRALTAAGFQVVVATTAPEIINRLFNGDFDVVVLCNSIPNDERRKLAGIIKSYSPSTPVIVISEMYGREYDYGTRITNGTPEALIAAIHQSFSADGDYGAMRSA